MLLTLKVLFGENWSTSLINQGDFVAIGEILYISECTFRFTL